MENKILTLLDSIIKVSLSILCLAFFIWKYKCECHPRKEETESRKTKSHYQKHSIIYSFHCLMLKLLQICKIFISTSTYLGLYSDTSLSFCVSANIKVVCIHLSSAQSHDSQSNETICVKNTYSDFWVHASSSISGNVLPSESMLNLNMYLDSMKSNVSLWIVGLLLEPAFDLVLFQLE